jgi:hypothetical protein
VDNFLSRVYLCEAFKARARPSFCRVCSIPPSFLLPRVVLAGLFAGSFPAFCFSYSLAVSLRAPLLRAVLPGCALRLVALRFFVVVLLLMAPRRFRRFWGILARLVFST